jgi:hypothetical protein
MIQKISQFFTYFLKQGIDYVMASTSPSRGIQSFLVTSGGTPDVVTFAGLGLPNMADANYVVLVNGETSGAVSVDESTKTVAGFSILGGGSSEVLNVVVIGRIKGMPAA